jgi:hypothetical protein
MDDPALQSLVGVTIIVTVIVDVEAETRILTRLFAAKGSPHKQTKDLHIALLQCACSWFQRSPSIQTKVTSHHFSFHTGATTYPDMHPVVQMLLLAALTKT